jgi:predicted HTH domain antitoxin
MSGQAGILRVVLLPTGVYLWRPSKYQEQSRQHELGHAIVEALLQAKIFPDRLTFQREAWHALLVLRPELRVEGAIALYRQGAISFARAAELSGLSQEDLKALLSARGMGREVASLTQEEATEATEALRRARL